MIHIENKFCFCGQQLPLEEDASQQNEKDNDDKLVLDNLLIPPLFSSETASFFNHTEILILNYYSEQFIPPPEKA